MTTTIHTFNNFGVVTISNMHSFNANAFCHNTASVESNTKSHHSKIDVPIPHKPTNVIHDKDDLFHSESSHVSHPSKSHHSKIDVPIPHKLTNVLNDKEDLFHSDISHTAHLSKSQRNSIQPCSFTDSTISLTPSKSHSSLQSNSSSHKSHKSFSSVATSLTKRSAVSGSPSKSLTPSIEVEMNFNTFSIYGLSEYVDTLHNWFGKNTMHMIYDSKEQIFDANYLNRKICGKKDLLLFVTTSDGYIFGSWTSKQIPPDKKDDFNYVRGDTEHFVFTLKNPHNIPPTRIYPKSVDKSSKSLCISGSRNPTTVISCYSCFFIENEIDESTIDFSFGSFYGDVTNKGFGLFTGKSTFGVTRLVAFVV
ncbi:TLDc domain-containing protein [Entamoeba marina]